MIEVKKMSTIEKFIIPIAAIILPFSGWIVSVILPADDWHPWYDALAKPDLNPPGYIFPPVWSFIYCSIGIASYLVYAKLVATGRGFDSTAQVVLASYAVQLALNWAWPPIFFVYHSLLWVCHRSE